MSKTQHTSDARRPSNLWDGDTNTQENAGANQREKATRDGSPGKTLVGDWSFFPSGLKRYPQSDVGPGSRRRARPSSRWATSHATTHNHTHACPQDQ